MTEEHQKQGDTLNVTLMQTSLVWESAQANRDHFSRLFTDLVRTEIARTDLVVLPEMFSTGFSMNSSLLAETMDGPTVTWLSEQAASLNSTICGSLIIEEAGHYYNRFIWAQPDGNIRHYDKRHLFRMSTENDHYTRGTDKQVFELNGFRICPQVCYDLRFPVWSRNDSNIDLLLYVANWPAVRKDHWSSLLKARAIENLCYTIGLNRVGTDGNDVEYTGNSVVLDYSGELLLDMATEEITASVQLKKHSLLEYRHKFPAYLDADSYQLDP